MHAAEVLGIPATDIKPSIADTDSIGYSSGAGGSGVTFKMGTAVYQAAEDVRNQLIERAATIWDVNKADVEFANGELSHKEDPELRAEDHPEANRPPAQRYRRPHRGPGNREPGRGG